METPPHTVAETDFCPRSAERVMDADERGAVVDYLAAGAAPDRVAIVLGAAA